MKILLMFFAAMANGQSDVVVNVRVAKYKPTANDDPIVVSQHGTGVSFKFQVAGGVQVSFKKDDGTTEPGLNLDLITEFKLQDADNQVLSSAELDFGKGKVTSSSLSVSTDKTRNFEAEDAFNYNQYYLKHGDSGSEKEVNMTIKASGIVLTPVDGSAAVTDFTKLKLHKVNGDAVIQAETPISMTGIRMKRVLTTSQSVKKEYTTKPLTYKMRVLVTEYYEAAEKKTPTETDAIKQAVEFVFPEEKKDGLQDGGIQIRFKNLLDATTTKTIDLYQSHPKFTITLWNATETTATKIDVTSANITLGNYMLKLHVQKDQNTKMNFMLTTNVYLTEDKSNSFIAEISSGVTVPQKTTAIQGWEKGSKKTDTTSTWENAMTFDKVVSLKDVEVTLTKTIDTIKETCTTSGGTTNTGTSGSTNTTNTNDTTTGTTDKCTNGVSQYFLAPLIAVLSLSTLLA